MFAYPMFFHYLYVINKSGNDKGRHITTTDRVLEGTAFRDGGDQPQAD